MGRAHYGRRQAEREAEAELPAPGADGAGLTGAQIADLPMDGTGGALDMLQVAARLSVRAFTAPAGLGAEQRAELLAAGREDFATVQAFAASTMPYLYSWSVGMLGAFSFAWASGQSSVLSRAALTPAAGLLGGRLEDLRDLLGGHRPRCPELQDHRQVRFDDLGLERALRHVHNLRRANSRDHAW
ncbi:hypothetical protein P3T27_006818 [Kitasatospora sp. MAA19]|uniref:hypothetical protein n=1 Tax=Kitasatospora sp. MAA19 TaxID=3035090 RepID=UPI002473478A|nr:hypothetical protein [Kitasatospora sp. MAA19]MDH6710069.1 hypothetical protein [Kitasatospora sp. MAA19]